MHVTVSVKNAKKILKNVLFSFSQNVKVDFDPKLTHVAFTFFVPHLFNRVSCSADKYFAKHTFYHVQIKEAE